MVEAMEARMEQTKAYVTLLFFLGSTAEAIVDTSLLSALSVAVYLETVLMV